MSHKQNFSNLRNSPSSRRQWLAQAGSGFGALALNSLLAENSTANDSIISNPLSSKIPQHFAKAKSVIFLFMEGGPSQIDLFDPKPLLNKLAGKPLPDSFGNVITSMGESRSPLLGCPRVWKQHGKAGTWASELIPHTANMLDDIAVIRSCVADGINHSAGVCQMNTGSILGGRQSLGSWATYGLVT